MAVYPCCRSSVLAVAPVTRLSLAVSIDKAWTPKPATTVYSAAVSISAASTP